MEPAGTLSIELILVNLLSDRSRQRGECRYALRRHGARAHDRPSPPRAGRPAVAPAAVVRQRRLRLRRDRDEM